MGDNTPLIDANLQRSIDVFSDIRAEANMPLLFNLEDIFLADGVIYEREAYRNAFSAKMGVSKYCKENKNARRDFECFFYELVLKNTIVIKSIKLRHYFFDLD